MDLGPILLFSNSLWSKGHEDIDQAFSQQAAVLSRHEFSTPAEVVALMDSSFRPELAADIERKKGLPVKADAVSFKIDEVADWQGWSAALGVKLLGLRLLVSNSWEKRFERFLVCRFFFAMESEEKCTSFVSVFVRMPTPVAMDVALWRKYGDLSLTQVMSCYL